MPVTYSDEIERIKQQIIQHFQPERIILFGSLARGESHPDCDIDLLIVDAAAQDRVARTVTYYQMIDYDIPTDFVLTNPNDFQAGCADPTNTFAQNICREGVTLYER